MARGSAASRFILGVRTRQGVVLVAAGEILPLESLALGVGDGCAPAVVVVVPLVAMRIGDAAGDELAP